MVDGLHLFRRCLSFARGGRASFLRGGREESLRWRGNANGAKSVDKKKKEEEEKMEK